MTPRARIVEAMTAQGVSVTELARRSGVSRSNISAYINGREGVTDTTLDRLAAALGCEWRLVQSDDGTPPSTASMRATRAGG